MSYVTRNESWVHTRSKMILTEIEKIRVKKVQEALEKAKAQMLEPSFWKTIFGKPVVDEKSVRKYITDNWWDGLYFVENAHDYDYVKLKNLVAGTDPGITSDMKLSVEDSRVIEKWLSKISEETLKENIEND